MTIIDTAKPFLLTTLLLFIFAIFNSGEGYYNLLVSGIPLMLFSILLVSMQILQQVFNNNSQNSLTNIVMPIIPLIINVASLSLFMYLIVTNKSSITGDCNKGNTNTINLDESVNDCVSNDYSNLNIGMFFLIICQLITMISMIFNSNFNNTGTIEPRYFILLFLFAFIQAILMIPIYTVLTFFKTDG